MAQINKSIENFLEKNGLSSTLKAFQAESRRSSHLPSKNAHASLSTIHKTTIPNDSESQSKLRDHLQKADSKYLKKFVERIKKTNKLQPEQNNLAKLAQQSFFKKLIQKQAELYEKYKQNVLMSMNAPPTFLDESRMYENQWEGQNDIGYEIIECQSNELQKILREIQTMKRYHNSPIKDVPYPEAYFSSWQQLRSTTSYNHNDKMPTKLPPSAVFEAKNKSKNQDEVYPIQSGEAVLASHDLKIIYDREKTGYEEEREMPIVINEVLAGRFQILSLLGQAQFSKAIEVKDLTSSNQKQRYCLKMILNNKDYMDQALDQIKLLRYIKANCNPDEACIVNMHDYFYHREHLMILTELLKQNLYDVYEQNPSYFSLPRLQLIVKQILTALATLHKLHIIHNDLKPQNILIKSYSNTLVKVIDVGSSVFFHDELQFYVQTRSYRAPEVILGCPYTEKIDIWSLGCIIAELFTGKVLFESDSVVGILARIQGLRGPWPSWMISSGSEVSKYFTKELILMEEIMEEIKEGDHKKKCKTGFNRIYLPKMTNLKSRINTDNKNFLDFLSKCLKIDPSARLSAKEALNHPFITETIS